MRKFTQVTLGLCLATILAAGCNHKISGNLSVEEALEVKTKKLFHRPKKTVLPPDYYNASLELSGQKLKITLKTDSGDKKIKFKINLSDDVMKKITTHTIGRFEISSNETGQPFGVTGALGEISIQQSEVYHDTESCISGSHSSCVSTYDDGWDCHDVTEYGTQSFEAYDILTTQKFSLEFMDAVQNTAKAKFDGDNIISKKQVVTWQGACR